MALMRLAKKPRRSWKRIVALRTLAEKSCYQAARTNPCQARVRGRSCSCGPGKMVLCLPLPSREGPVAPARQAGLMVFVDVSGMALQDVEVELLVLGKLARSLAVQGGPQGDEVGPRVFWLLRPVQTCVRVNC